MIENLRVYVVINWLNKNLETFDMAQINPPENTTSKSPALLVLQKEHFYGKTYAENMHQKPIQDLFLIFVESKQPMQIVVKKVLCKQDNLKEDYQEKPLKS